MFGVRCDNPSCPKHSFVAVDPTAAAAPDWRPPAGWFFRDVDVKGELRPVVACSVTCRPLALVYVRGEDDEAWSVVDNVANAAPVKVKGPA